MNFLYTMKTSQDRALIMILKLFCVRINYTWFVVFLFTHNLKLFKLKNIYQQPVSCDFQIYLAISKVLFTELLPWLSSPYIVLAVFTFYIQLNV